MNLELMAMRWLRWEKRCVIVLTERSPRANLCGEPDVLGMTKDRYLYEIEVKRSLSDFKQDADKPSRRFRNADWRAPKYPKQFYYLTPPGISDRVHKTLPDWAGLMRGPTEDEVQCVRVIHPSPIWKPSTRLTPKECGYLVMKMSNQILSLAEANEQSRNNRVQTDGNDDWRLIYHPSYQNFQI